MKHWKKDEDSISLNHDEKTSWNRILDITKTPEGFVFEEGCDDYFSVTLSKTESIEALEEAIQYIKDN